MHQILALALSSHVKLLRAESDVQAQVLNNVLASYFLTTSG